MGTASGLAVNSGTDKMRGQAASKLFHLISQVDRYLTNNICPPKYSQAAASATSTVDDRTHLSVKRLHIQFYLSIQPACQRDCVPGVPTLGRSFAPRCHARRTVSQWFVQSRGSDLGSQQGEGPALSHVSSVTSKRPRHCGKPVVTDAFLSSAVRPGRADGGRP
ncbi:hypothetical protein F2P81_002347 [Scophthalmus maximus]|uniref:Uncharacterized protein n=1 Tax=Scophthalmus maximus TaxID=52904 RepID=A0A6A4TN70_SCOMX|nr:hypothetical protein F2P81_002347 [Scophthalmus maximus]